jgi:hypothetical protein
VVAASTAGAASGPVAKRAKPANIGGCISSKSLIPNGGPCKPPAHIGGTVPPRESARFAIFRRTMMRSPATANADSTGVEGSGTRLTRDWSRAHGVTRVDHRRVRRYAAPGGCLPQPGVQRRAVTAHPSFIRSACGWPNAASISIRIRPDGEKVAYSVTEGGRRTVYPSDIRGRKSAPLCTDCGLPWCWTHRPVHRETSRSGVPRLSLAQRTAFFTQRRPRIGHGPVCHPRPSGVQPG